MDTRLLKNAVDSFYDKIIEQHYKIGLLVNSINSDDVNTRNGILENVYNEYEKLCISLEKYNDTKHSIQLLEEFTEEYTSRELHTL